MSVILFAAIAFFLAEGNSAATVAVYEDASFHALCTPGGFGDESCTLQATLTSLGHTVFSFSGTTGADFATAHAASDMVVFPENEGGGSLGAPALSALAAGPVIYFANNHPVMNGAYGFSLISSGPGTSIIAGSPPSEFVGAAASLPSLSGTSGCTLGSLPAGSDIVYTGASAAVWGNKLGAQPIAYLGWDWFNAAPLGTADSGWVDVLDRTVAYIGSPSCLGTTTSNTLNNCVCPAAESENPPASGTCVAIADPEVCPTVASSCAEGQLALVQDDGTEFCFDSLPVAMGTVELLAGTGVDVTIDNDPLLLGTWSVGQAVVSGTRAISAALTGPNGDTIEWFATGGGCGVTVELNGANFNVMRKRQAGGSASTLPFTVSAAGASGDPHIRGAQGQRFDFFGKSNEIYTLFSAPQFVVNMQLLAQGPADKFIDVLFVHFRNVTLRFDTGTYKADKMQARVNKQLTGVTDARVVVGPRHSEIELCDGHRIVIEQRVDTDKIDHKQRKFYHLDVKIDVPGCHNDFGGILGETYRCDGEFKWDRSREESFHVSTGHDVSKDSKFSPSAPCHDNAKVFAGRKIMSGNTGKKM